MDTDFRRVCEGFEKFTTFSRWDRDSVESDGTAWEGARISDVIRHQNLDLKPRRLMPKALANARSVASGQHVRLGTIATVLDETTDILEGDNSDKWRLVEGTGIRAVEGVVIPEPPARAWRVAERKSKLLFALRHRDIIIGLVRPERRNIGLLSAKGTDLVGAPDGIAVVRVKAAYMEEYPQKWLFAAMRSEACRLQFWTESGGTSYGKLTRDNILNVLIPTPPKKQRLAVADKVEEWLGEVDGAAQKWDTIGSPEDRFPVINSPSFGLVESSPGAETDGEEDGDE